MAKRFQLSSDGTTYYTMPGNTAEFQYDSQMVDDTIFGQDFASQFTNMQDWKMQSNGYFKGLAGYQVTLKKSGTPTTMTAEACTLVSGKTYQITNAAHRIMDPATVPTVLGNAVTIAEANILNIDYLFGTVTFISSYTPTTPITITGKYLPTSVIAGARAFNLGMTMNAFDDTTIADAQANGGIRIYDFGIKDVKLELTGIYSLSNGSLASVQSRAILVAEICPDGSQLAVARGFFQYGKTGQSGKVGDQEDESAALSLYVPNIDNLKAPFSWVISGSSTLSPAIQKAISAWQNKTFIYGKYSPDGTAGVLGQGVVTDITLSGGLDVLNEFSFAMQGSGAVTPF